MVYTDNGKLRVVYGDYVLGVHGKGFDYTFSYAQGGLEPEADLLESTDR